MDQSSPSHLVVLARHVGGRKLLGIVLLERRRRAALQQLVVANENADVCGIAASEKHSECESGTDTAGSARRLTIKNIVELAWRAVLQVIRHDAHLFVVGRHCCKRAAPAPRAGRAFAGRAIGGRRRSRRRTQKKRPLKGKGEENNTRHRPPRGPSPAHTTFSPLKQRGEFLLSTQRSDARRLANATHHKFANLHVAFQTTVCVCSSQGARPGARRDRRASPVQCRTFFRVRFARCAPAERTEWIFVTMEGECVVCREAVSGQLVSASGKKFHPDCFVCVQCLMPFPGGKFFESLGKLYCEADYQTCFGNRCGRCGESIMGRCVTALDMKWHPEHFTCDMCGSALAGTSFVKRLGRPYCKDCVVKLREQEQEAQRNMCDKCKKPITNRNEMLVIKRQKFHAYHFTCSNLTCRKDLDGDCKELDGKFYCPACHSKALVATCAACHRPIEGRSITALGKQFHPEVRWPRALPLKQLRLLTERALLPAFSTLCVQSAKSHLLAVCFTSTRARRTASSTTMRLRARRAAAAAGHQRVAVRVSATAPHAPRCANCVP